MSRHFLILAAFFLFMPLKSMAVSVEATEPVEDPDGISSSQIPQDTAGKDDRAEKPPEPPKPEAEKKPGDTLESGYNTVILQGLNKVTGHSQKIEAVIGSTVRFGTLEIVPRSCWKSAPEDSPENAVLMEIYETKQGEPPEKIFLGWMFSSSPGISSLEHPFYDITVITCAKSDGSKL